MSTPVVFGGLGLGIEGQGRIALGGPQPVRSYALPKMSKTAQPYIAHLYDFNLKFKRTLGGATILKKPSLKQTQNGGFQAITISVATPQLAWTLDSGIRLDGSHSLDQGIVLGDVIRLTEQGDAPGPFLYSGNVETTPEEQSPAGTHHQIVLTPWIAELAEAFFNKNYTVPTDVAQFVRDAVAQTAHCSVSPLSCPDTGITHIYDFQNAHGLDAVHVAKQIAGANYWYFVDPQGLVWFQPIYTDALHPATITLVKGTDFNFLKPVSTIVGQKNLIPVMGGSLPGETARLKSTYGVGDPLGHQAKYGIRAFNPTPTYPTVTDQATLDAIAASLGAQYDRVWSTAELHCPALGVRLSPARPGGMTVRYLSGGAYSPNFVLQDVEALGPQQNLIIGDIPYTDSDPAYEATRIAQRISVVSATAAPSPVVTPPVQPPPSTVVVAQATVPNLGILPMGGGVVALVFATFTTTKAGTIQLTGQIDAGMQAWSNQIAAPRRDVWLDLAGIVTNPRIELPFGTQGQVARIQPASSSALGIALPAGTYTATWYCETREFNQIHIWGGWLQVIWTG